jgi:hypothetical protein
MGNSRENVIDLNKWTLFDKVMYGGLGYGSFCLPSSFFKVFITVLFPPLGEIVNIIADEVSYDMPFLNWGVIKSLVDYQNISKIIYSFLLTTLFYIPGLVYTLGNIANKDNKLF